MSAKSTDSTLYHLNHLSLLKVSGADADTFLQGQLTNDINQLNNNWQFSGYCNPKGRLLALFQLWREGEQICLMLPTELVPSIQKRLKMYVLRSQVTIELEERLIYGANTLGALEQSNIKQPEPNQFEDPQAAYINAGSIDESQPDATFLHWQNRFILITSQTLETNGDLSEWQGQDIRDGIPQITQATSELFVPQMINLDLLDGINFKKGCYTGQEIVARMHYLGKVKQRLYIAEADSLGKAQIGDPVYSNEKNIGHVLNSTTEQSTLLTVIRTEYKEAQLHLEDGTQLTII